MSSCENPVPDLLGRALSLAEYRRLTPEKIELLDGYLCGPEENHEPRLSLMAALATNEGLQRVVTLAPPERWYEALKLVYGEKNAP